MAANSSPPRFLTRSRIRRLRTAGVTGFVLGAAVLGAPLRGGPLTTEVSLQVVAGVTSRRSATTSPTTVATTSTVPPPTATTSRPAPTTTTARPVARPTPATTPPRPPVALAGIGSYGVGYEMLDLTDTSRPTPAAAGQPARPGRHLPTIVRYPAAAVPAGSEVANAAPLAPLGPFPLVVFAHGYNSSPAVYGALMHAWASAGYVVAAPSFPLATMGGPLDEADVVNQPGDLSFVITTLLALNSTPGNTLGHLIDPAHIAATGHSDGGETVMGIATNSCCLDRRLSAAIEMSGDMRPFPGTYFGSRTPPLLDIQGDADPINYYSLGLQIYNSAPSPVFMLTLLGGGHLEPFTTDTAHLAVVEACSIDFLNYYLKGRSGGLVSLRADAVARGNATLVAH
jgi:hypothetical protein